MEQAGGEGVGGGGGGGRGGGEGAGGGARNGSLRFASPPFDKIAHVQRDYLCHFKRRMSWIE